MSAILLLFPCDREGAAGLICSWLISSWMPIYQQISLHCSFLRKPSPPPGVGWILWHTHPQHGDLLPDASYSFSSHSLSDDSMNTYLPHQTSGWLPYLSTSAQYPDPWHLRIAGKSENCMLICQGNLNTTFLAFCASMVPGSQIHPCRCCPVSR